MDIYFDYSTKILTLNITLPSTRLILHHGPHRGNFEYIGGSGTDGLGTNGALKGLRFAATFSLSPLTFLQNKGFKSTHLFFVSSNNAQFSLEVESRKSRNGKSIQFLPKENQMMEPLTSA